MGTLYQQLWCCRGASEVAEWHQDAREGVPWQGNDDSCLRWWFYERRQDTCLAQYPTGRREGLCRP